MTDLRQANIAALGHLVAMRDLMVDDGSKFIAHAEALDECHRDKELAMDSVLTFRAVFGRLDAAVRRLDPDAPPASLDAPAPLPERIALAEAPLTFAPSGNDAPGVMIDNRSGVMVLGDDVEALRTHRIGETVRHAQTLAAARFTPEEQGRWNLLRQLAQAADENVTPPLTEEQLAELAALDADQRWSVNTQAEAWARVDALLTADSETLASYNASDGWAE